MTVDVGQMPGGWRRCVQHQGGPAPRPCAGTVAGVTATADTLGLLAAPFRRGAERLDALPAAGRARQLAALAVAAHEQPALLAKLHHLLDLWAQRAAPGQTPVRQLSARLVIRCAHHPNPDPRQVEEMLAALDDDLAARLAARHFARPHDPWGLPADIAELARLAGRLSPAGRQVAAGLLHSDSELSARQIVAAADAVAGADQA